MSKEQSVDIAFTVHGMQDAIRKAGGLFYQYRACRRNESTIYDIENIRHGVVYAQTPLNMNDPFDSMIGFSPERFYDECISYIVDAISIKDDSLKQVLIQLLKYRAIGKMAEFIHNLNSLKKYLTQRRQAMHQTHVGFKAFVHQNTKALLSKCPKELKSYFHGSAFVAFSLVVSEIDTAYISENDVYSLLNMDELLDKLYQEAIRIRDTIYVPQIRHFLEKLTVTCFSHSGWDNQLMWSHYANSYSGICIEYDFSQIKDFVGFISPVEYKAERPTLSLSDVGVQISSNDGKPKVETNTDTDMKKIMSYLLVKNTCWSYEDEWRIINVGEPNTPAFIPLPYIKSITFGLHVDDLCKALLWDVCKEKNIDCYQLLISTDSYKIDRRKLQEDDIPYDEERESRYIDLLVQRLNESSSKVENYTQSFMSPEKVSPEDWAKLPTILEGIIDMLADVFFLKLSMNRLAENTQDDFTTKDEVQKTIEGLENIDNFVAIAKENASKLQNTLPTLFLGGILYNENRKRAQQLLRDIMELTAKCDLIVWTDKINPSRLKELIGSIPKEG